ncbi:uncharacterized protein LOC126747569 [Anthonomus grandis grandis]|uniref:uncharacterized protein LOC126747569 n=1 Tax=Anthonomus grandis grandis TaxID=2921223 RepID=UPI0021665D96|nr:uncharacterized protein LOC126747569 [Anthonomus grandis grandis]
MTDDDPKYYNAWVKVMGSVPRKLLCSWHIMKNWVIQGRSKIQNDEIKKSMKSDMKKILNEIKMEAFIDKTTKYFKKLENANEIAFLSYLKKYYFQNEERIAMWAHCYRVNAGVNTNMSIESLNNFLKSNMLKRKANITIDKLMDVIEDLVDAKMWQRVLKLERPDADNYQDKVIVKAHKMAENMDMTNMVTEIEFGRYQVKNTKEEFYNVSLNEVCEVGCKTLYCKLCKICFHRYTCECPQYCIKTTICKHIHLICLYEQRKGSDSVLGDVAELLGECSSNNIEASQSVEIETFVNEKTTENQQVAVQPLNKQSRREIEIESVSNFLRSLNDET